MNSWGTSGRMMSAILRHFGRQSAAALLARAYLTILLITLVDYVTRIELSLLIFYFFPIIVVSWFLGKRQGIGIALAATLATALHDLLQVGSFSFLGAQDLYYYWSLFQRGGVFLMVGFIVAALRASEGEKRNIEHLLARKVQSFLLPQTARSTGSLTCFGLCKSSDHLTGDFFDLIPLGPTKLAILVGDICGTGISAALLMAYIQGLLRSHVPFAEEALGELMNNINRSLHRVTADDKFATLFIGVYNEENHLLTYVNAGHDPPVIFRLPEVEQKTTLPEIVRQARSLPQTPFTETAVEALKLRNGGLLLGVDPNYEYCTSIQELRHGDVFVSDTDGMKEAMNQHGEMYGAERLT
ncbi:MAG: serine/threonine-protein phosphatase, partial [Proteobacteria bacterium]|nr:serine/threonine-protein phosphatase [Pseudomonadota bacterium]